jgi:hypothetical protein
MACNRIEFVCWYHTLKRSYSSLPTRPRPVDSGKSSQARLRMSLSAKLNNYSIRERIQPVETYRVILRQAGQVINYAVVIHSAANLWRSLLCSIAICMARPQSRWPLIFAVGAFIVRVPFHSKGRLGIINILQVSVVRMGKFSDNTL